MEGILDVGNILVLGPEVVESLVSFVAFEFAIFFLHFKQKSPQKNYIFNLNLFNILININYVAIQSTLTFASKDSHKSIFGVRHTPKEESDINW